MIKSTKRKNRESSIRWHDHTTQQFGFALNLILGLSVAALGYELSFLEKNPSLNCWQIACSLLSLVSLFLSTTLGLICTVNRLRDFRATTDIAKRRENGESGLALLPDRMFVRTLGKRSWILFEGQIWSFGVGILLLTLAVLGSIIKPIILHS
jgi:hypothetical protein